MPFEMVAIPLCYNAVATSLPHEPHAFVDVPISVDHTPFPVGLVVEPKPVIAVAVLVEHRSSSGFFII